MPRCKKCGSFYLLGELCYGVCSSCRENERKKEQRICSECGRPFTLSKTRSGMLDTVCSGCATSYDET